MLPAWLDWGRNGPNANWHRRWILLLLTAGPMALAAACIFVYGPQKGMGAATLFIGTAFVEGLKYGVLRYKGEKEKGGEGA